MSRMFALAALAAAFGARVPSARADDDPASAVPVAHASPIDKLDRPWNLGVVPGRQEVARQYLREGNGFLKNSQFKQAAEKYRKALAEWNHPGLHFNLALALSNLDQPVEVHEHLKMALQYGPDPIGEEKYNRAQEYLRLVRKQIAEVDIRCDVKGAVVSLDGTEVFRVGDQPGRYQGFLTPGLHTVTAAKDGYATTEKAKVLLPGRPEVFALKLHTPNELIGYSRHWPLWRPVALTAFGGAMLIAGAVSLIEARSRYDSYDRYSRANCTAGCAGDPQLNDFKQSGDRFRAASTLLFVAGGTVVALGTTLLFLDRAVPYQVNPDGDGRDLALGRAARWTPWLGRGGAGLLGTLRF